ncbi:MAG: rod shape-determining protein MreD [Candidatus Nanopelagicales bacterium]
MSWLRAGLMALLVLTAVIVQLTVLPLLGLPGATPDLVAVTVVGLGLVGGPVRGTIAGFGAGLLLDLLPPADGLLGLTAVLLVTIGYLAGLLGQSERSPLSAVLLAGLLSGGVVLGYALVGGVVADPRVSWERVPGLLFTQVAYAVVLAPFVLALITWLWRKVDPPPPRYDVGRA